MNRWKKILLTLFALAFLAYLVSRCMVPDDEDYSILDEERVVKSSTIII